jgi:hypothetical protein
MRKVVFKYFFDAIDGQQKWLNEMADQGYRLTKVSNFSFHFEACEPHQYQYHVELVTEKSYPALIRRQELLMEQGLRSFSKNISLNLSTGKAKKGSWSKVASGNVSDPANYELLILEFKKEDFGGASITEDGDILRKYRDIRAVYIFLLLLAAGYLIYRYNAASAFETGNLIINGLLAITSVFSVFVVWKYSRLIRRIKD